MDRYTKERTDGQAIDERISYAKDVAAAVGSIGGLSFSVGFYLQSADIDEDANGREYLIITEGELEEISAVVFPGNSDATMERQEKGDPFDQAMATLAKLQLHLKSDNPPPATAGLSEQLAEMKRIFS
ncbi:HK97 family phage prohead protease [Hoeflea sp.]|uniref:HK97 family phage prohead protease n=1 Tax=Hoeflea sp. TaxID=1940281 RepID=UPI0025B9EB6C|nr:HK97 family phage prohead protease [Hoeflea sp.]